MISPELSRPSPEVIMFLGSGHDIIDGQYVASLETARRAIAASVYWERDPDQDPRYHFSGYYAAIASRGEMQAPPPEKSEAALGLQIFNDRLRDIVTLNKTQTPGNAYQGLRYEPLTSIEDESTDTFTNFINSIKGGYLVPGQISPDNPLVLATGYEHVRRSSVIVSQGLGLPEGDGSVRHLAGNYGGGLIMSARERVLLAVTRLSLADIGETSGAEPGNLAHTEEAARAFAEYSLQPVRAVREAMRHPELWRIPHVPELVP